MTGAWMQIIDTATGQTVMYWDALFSADEDSGSEYGWTEGNYACDCNRALFFARAQGKPDPDDRECGMDRYSVPWAFLPDGHKVEIDGDAE